MQLSGDGKMPVLHFGMTGMLQVSCDRLLLVIARTQAVSLDQGSASNPLQGGTQECLFRLAAEIYESSSSGHQLGLNSS